MHYLASTFWNAATWNDGERSHSQLETTKSTNDSLLLGADEREESKRENPLIVNKYTQLAEFQHALNSYDPKIATMLHFASMREINPVRTFVYWVICLCLCVCLFIRPHSIGCGLLLHSCAVCLLVTTVSPITRSSAIAEGPRDASCQLKFCQLPRNSA